MSTNKDSQTKEQEHNTEEQQHNKEHTILPELKELLPTLTEEEYKKLEKNIIETEEVRDPLVFADIDGKYILLDGHNRHSIIQKHKDKDISWEPTYIDNIKDIEDAKQWIINNQLGKRNLSDKDKAYYIGQLYTSRKKERGSVNQHTKSANGNSCHLQNTSEQIAQEQGVSARTVRNAAKFSESVDKLADGDANKKQQLLSSKKTQKEIIKEAHPENQHTKSAKGNSCHLQNTSEDKHPLPETPFPDWMSGRPGQAQTDLNGWYYKYKYKLEPDTLIDIIESVLTQKDIQHLKDYMIRGK